jgi:peptidoglycan/xylan/chitin deacetylase (PgdA/CDA1 family)
MKISPVCNTGRRLLILTFHGIGEYSRALRPGEEGVWLSEEVFRSIIDVIRHRSDVMLTVDDGNRSDASIVMPTLLEYGMKATFFLAAGHLDTPGYISRAAVRNMVQEGMKIGSHGIYHRNWRDLSGEQLSEEVHKSREILEQVTGGPVTEAACPFGAYDRCVIRHLRKARYERVYTSDRGFARRGNWLMPRNSLHTNDGPESVMRMICQSSFGPRAWLRLLKKTFKRFR